MKYKRKRKNKPIKILIIALILGAIVFTVAKYIDFPSNDILSGSNSSKRISLKTVNMLENEIKTISLDDVSDTYFLTLLDSSHQMSVPTEKLSLSDVYGIVALSRADIKLNSATINATSDFFNKAKQDDISGLYITSGYRSVDKQETLYNENIQKLQGQGSNYDDAYIQTGKTIAVPGHSEHHLGMAIDIASSNTNKNITTDFDTTSEFRWLKQNCADFGFVMSFPKEKESITGISYEPWHFRYTGLPHSAIIDSNNWCLKEYLDSLKENKWYKTNIENNQYFIIKQSPVNNEIIVPVGMEYSVSSDNDGFYIVTAKK